MVTERDSFSDDAPKRNPWRDDALGYRAFSERLTTALIAMKAPKGYVIGLHGPWGSGKSTVLNFVEALISKRQQEDEDAYKSIRLIRFEPWIVSGYQDLAAAFFKQLSQHIADGISQRSARKRKVAKTLKMGMDPAIDAAATLGAAMDHSGGVLSKGAAAVTKKGLSSAIDRWLAEPSLQDEYEQLTNRLEHSPTRFIVMIDDIDRLTSLEIRSIMQMVKTVGRLPHVIYLLAYDRRIVWTALRDGEKLSDGHPEFAEKIVQHELELPIPSRHSLMAMLEEQTPQIPSAPPSSMRWFEMLHSGLFRWIKSPRDVARMANGLRFSWPALEGEVDPQDLICMEGLRLFERPVYEWIRDHRDLLLREGRARLLLGEEDGAAISSIRAICSEECFSDVITLLCQLFPNSTKVFRGEKNQFGGDPWFEVAARRGIATKPAFDAYFSLNPKPTEIPKSLIDLAVRNSDDEAMQLDCIRDAIDRRDEFGNSLVADYLQELIYRLSQQTLIPTQALLNALLICEPEIDSAPWEGDIFSPSGNLRLLVAELMKAAGSERAGEMIATAFKSVRSLETKAGILTYQARQLGMFPDGSPSGDPAISKSALELLARNLAAEISECARTGALDSSRAYYDMLRIWSYFGDDAQARAWISKIAQSSASRLAVVADGLLGYSRGDNGKNYSLWSKPDPKMYDLGVLKDASERYLDQPGLTEDERRKISALNDALQRLADPETEEGDKD